MIRPIDLQIVLAQQSAIGKKEVLKDASLHSDQNLSNLENFAKTEDSDQRVSKKEESKQVISYSNDSDMKIKEREGKKNKQEHRSEKKDFLDSGLGQKINKISKNDIIKDDSLGKKIDISQ